MGDVQGKGLIAVKTAATVLSAFREVAHDAADLQRIAERIELSLARQLNAEQFVTALLVQVAPDGSKVQLLSCGHPPPLLVAGGMGRFVEAGRARPAARPGHLGAFPREVATLAFSPGDQLLLYTDGVSEARDKLGEFFPLSQCRALCRGQDPEQALAGCSMRYSATSGTPWTTTPRCCSCAGRRPEARCLLRGGCPCWPPPCWPPPWSGRNHAWNRRVIMAGPGAAQMDRCAGSGAAVGHGQQVTAHLIQIDRILEAACERGLGGVRVVARPVEPPVHGSLHPAPQQGEQRRRHQRQPRHRPRDANPSTRSASSTSPA